MITQLVFIINIILLLAFHEIGHALVAKRDHIFLKFGVSPFGPCCHLSKSYDSRWKYLSGFAGSFLALPCFVATMGLGNAWLFLVLAGAGALMDFVVCAFYGKLTRDD